MSFNFFAVNPELKEEKTTPSGMVYQSYGELFDFSENKMVHLFMMEHFPQDWKIEGSGFNDEGETDTDLLSFLEKAQDFISSVVEDASEDFRSLREGSEEKGENGGTIINFPLISDNRLRWFIEKVNELSIYASDKGWKTIRIYGI